MGDVLVGGDQGGDEAGQDTIDLIVTEGVVKSSGEVRGVGLRLQSDRTMSDLKSPAHARLRGEGSKGGRVADYGHPDTAWQRLVNHQLGHVEELVHVLNSDHPGLAQHGVEGC